ncbi:MAG TPA: butyrate kinase [Firmicutes bacterium]|nr:butyrate kinase [Bacillota bacterium]
MEHLILVINPGSTSTKLAVYENKKQKCETSLHHSNEDLARFGEIVEQRSFREKLIVRWLEDKGIPLLRLTAVVARGGLLAPMPGGTYSINTTMVSQLERGLYGKHASNLAGLIAYDLGRRLNIPAYIVDPVVVDEMEPIARISGLPEIERKSIFHALNHKASAKKAADLMGCGYDQLNLIVAHLGGGISIGAHHRGRVVDVNNALTGEGPFSPERSGSLPPADLINYYFDNGCTKGELIRKFAGNSGLVAQVGTNDCRLIEAKIAEGDSRSRLYLETMAYQIAKEIGRISTVLCGKVDQIVLTGGLAYSAVLVGEIEKRVGFIAPLQVLPGENELEALALGAWRVLAGEEEVRDYAGGGVNK